jgi:hypothetical protein
MPRRAAYLLFTLLKKATITRGLLFAAEDFAMRVQAVGCLLLLAASVLPARADEEALRQKLTDFLTTCWDTSDDAQLLADTKFAALEKIAGVDPRAFYGHGLVMLHQRRYAESAKSLDQVVRIDAEHLPAWQAKVWLALLLKKYDIALAGMEDLAEVAGKLAEDADNKDAAGEAARFLGSAYGFVDGPLGEVAAVSARHTTEKAILAALSDEQRMAFTEARQAVIEKFTELTSERADSRDLAIADEEAEKQKVLADVDKRRAEMQTQADDLQERREKVAGELKDELADISRLDRPLLAQLTGLQTQSAAAQASSDNVLIDIQRLENRLAGEKDQARRDQIRRDIRRLNALLRQYDAELAVITTGIAGVQGERSVLFTRQKAAERNLGGQLQAIDRQAAAFQAEERKLAGIERKAKKPSSGSTGKVTGLGMTAAALKTYEPFPIERERERLLDSLK